MKENSLILWQGLLKLKSNHFFFKQWAHYFPQCVSFIKCGVISSLDGSSTHTLPCYYIVVIFHKVYELSIVWPIIEEWPPRTSIDGFWSYHVYNNRFFTIMCSFFAILSFTWFILFDHTKSFLHKIWICSTLCGYTNRCLNYWCALFAFQSMSSWQPKFQEKPVRSVDSIIYRWMMPTETKVINFSWHLCFHVASSCPPGWVVTVLTGMWQWWNLLNFHIQEEQSKVKQSFSPSQPFLVRIVRYWRSHKYRRSDSWKLLKMIALRWFLSCMTAPLKLQWVFFGIGFHQQPFIQEVCYTTLNRKRG